MKIINEKEFGLLYDKLYEYLQQTEGNIYGAIKERGEVNRTLTQFWYCGKTWETVTLIIAYHNSRKDSLILKFSNITVKIPKSSSLKEIKKLLDIKADFCETCEISEEEFTEEYKNLKSLVTRAKTKKEFVVLLDNLKITSNNRSHLHAYRKSGKIWEMIVSFIVLMRIGIYKEIVVNTDKGKLVYTGKEQDCFLVLEKIENLVNNQNTPNNP